MYIVSRESWILRFQLQDILRHFSELALSSRLSESYLFLRKSRLPLTAPVEARSLILDAAESFLLLLLQRSAAWVTLASIRTVTLAEPSQDQCHERCG